MKGRGHSIQDVYRKALGDPKFWKQLRSDVKGALKNARLDLAPAEIAELEQAVKRETIEINQAALFEALHARKVDDYWAGAWVGRWPIDGRWPLQ